MDLCLFHFSFFIDQKRNQTESKTKAVNKIQIPNKITRANKIIIKFE